MLIVDKSSRVCFNLLSYSIIAKQVELPPWTDIVKTARFKELAPYDADWYFVRAGESPLFVYLFSMHSFAIKSAKMSCCYHVCDVYYPRSLSHDHFIKLIQPAWLGKSIWGEVSVWGLLSGFMVGARGMAVALHTFAKAVVLLPGTSYNSCRNWTLLMLIPRGKDRILVGCLYFPCSEFNVNWLYLIQASFVLCTDF